MDNYENESQHELESSEPEIFDGDDSEHSKNYELFTIQVDEDLNNFHESTEDFEDQNAENEAMAESCAEQEVIDKLLKETITIAQATELLGQDLTFEDEVDEDELPDTAEVDHALHFSNELQQQQRRHMKVGRRGRRPGKRQLPPAIAGLMGEANLKLATRQFAEAEKMCLELIRRYPHSAEPFETLAMIYEEKSMPVKSVQYWFIAAFLSSNPNTWVKLAHIFAQKLNDPQQAIFCYGRAITADPKNIKVHWSRAKLLEYIGDSGRAINSYMYTLKFLKPDQGTLGIELAIEIAKIHHSNDDIEKAQEILENALRKYRSFVLPDAINLLLEVLLQQGNYARCLEVLIEQNTISLGSEKLTAEEFANISPPDQVPIATLCTNRENMPLDLMAKFAIALIHLKKDAIANSVVDDIRKEDVTEFGDLFLEISEAYYKNEKFEEAISLLAHLLSCEKFNLAAVWLQYAEALSAANQLEEAAEAYASVIKLAPQHSGTRVSMSNILKRLGRETEALSVLSEGDIAGPLDLTVLYNRCQMLKKRNETDEFIRTAKLLMQKHFLNLRSKEEVEAIINLKKVKHKHEVIKDMRAAKGDLNEYPTEYVGEDVPMDKQWQIFIELCEVLFNTGRLEELEWLSFNALGSTEFMTDPEKAKDIEFICLIACINNNSFYFAYGVVRDVVIRQPDSCRAWNLLCYVILRTDDIRHNEFLLRLTYKNHDSLPLSVLNGHNCLAAGSYTFAMAEYTQVFKQERQNPLISLMLGLTYTHMACQKFSGNKHDLAIKGAALLQTYLQTRGECQESYYNLGRAMHQLNILPQTIHYYKKALEFGPVIEDPDGNFDLTKEIAFNLSLVYKKSENSKLVRYYLCKYINV